MYEELNEKITLFTENYNILKKELKWESAEMVTGAALIYTGKGRTPDAEKLDECAAILKKNTGALSSFRNTVRTIMLANMAVSEDPLQYLDDIKSIYGKLRENRKFSHDEFTVISAIILLESGRREYIDMYIRRTEEVYDLMKASHPHITNAEDLPFAALLAATDEDTSLLTDDADKCFDLLHGFAGRDALQAVSIILALSKLSPEEKCEKFKAVFAALKDSGHRYGKGHELSILAALLMLDMETDELVNRIAFADDALKTVKGFHTLSPGASNRLLCSTALVLEAGQAPDAEDTANTSAAEASAAVIAVESAINIVNIVNMEMIILYLTLMNTAIISMTVTD